MPPGQTQIVVNIPIIGDTRPEPNEFFTILTTSDYLRPVPLGAPQPFRFNFTEVTIIAGQRSHKPMRSPQRTHFIA
jgi:hypothetical protein